MKKRKIVSALCAASIAASSQTFSVCYAQSTYVPEVYTSNVKGTNGEPLYGDANCDGVVDNDDVAFLKAFIFAEDPGFTEEGKRNADVHDPGLNLDEDDYYVLNNYVNARGSIPVYATIKKPLYGDVNCDGDIDKEDFDALSAYLNKQGELTKQGMVNADVHSTGNGLDVKDLDALEGFLEGEYDIPLWNGFDGTQTKTTTKKPAETTTTTKKTTAAATTTTKKTTTAATTTKTAVVTTTTAATTTKTAVVTTTTAAKKSDKFLYGDVNCDGEVDIEDLALLTARLSEDSVNVSELGMRNADVYDPGLGVDLDDETTLRKYINGNCAVPFYAQIEEPLYGDVNLDGEVNDKDLQLLDEYLEDGSNVKLKDQAKVNADVHEPNGGINVKDRDAIEGFLNGDYDLPLWNGFVPDEPATTTKTVTSTKTTTTTTAPATTTETPVTTTVSTTTIVYGDTNCDGEVNVTDLSLLNGYLAGEDVKISENGKLNADVYNHGSGLDSNDSDALSSYIKGVGTLPVIDRLSVTLYGDVNCDGVVDIRDNVLINRSLSDPSFVLLDQGRINGDVYNHGSGLTGMDSNIMAEYLVDKVAIPFVDSNYVTLYGDMNCDSDVDVRDNVLLNRYLEDPSVKVLDQGKINADVYNHGSGLTASDSEALSQALAKKVKLPVVNKYDVTLYGDANCDGTVDSADTDLISSYIDSENSLKISEQGKINADVYNSGSGITDKDLDCIKQFLADSLILPVVNKADVTLYGDVNCDGEVDVSDSVLLAGYVSDPENVKISEQGMINADVYNPGSGLTSEDTDMITKSVAGNATLPVINKLDVTLFGDVNCDDEIDLTDTELLNRYLTDATSVYVSPQGLINADVYNPGSGADFTDSAAINDYIAGKGKLPVVNKFSVTLFGDVNCDGNVDVTDTVILNRYVNDNESVQISAQGKINADAYNPGSGLDLADCEAITSSIAGKKTLPVVNDHDVTLYGDVNCDGMVDVTDSVLLERYISEDDKVAILEQGRINADVYNHGSGIDKKDAETLTGSLAKKNELPLINPDDVTLYGDVNCDGDVDVTDSVLLSQFINNPDTEIFVQGKINADVFKPGSGITPTDSEVLLKYIAGTVTLPVTDDTVLTLYGDVNCDGEVDIEDAELLNSYLDDDTVEISEQGLINADVFDPGFVLNYMDVKTIQNYIDGKNDLPVSAKFIYGDVNCDGDVDAIDTYTLSQYLNDSSSVVISDQGKINADVYNPGSGLNANDFDAITNAIGASDPLPVIDPFDVTLYGDVNCDGEVDAADNVLLNKLLVDSSEDISIQGKINADVYNPGSGLTLADVDAISQSIVGLDTLPVINKKYITEYGDVNCDGDVDVTDVTLINAYISGEKVKIFEQGKINADVYDPGFVLNEKDAEAIGEFVKGNVTLPVKAEFIYGDVNCDGVVDVSDSVLISRYLNDSESVVISDQGMINADVYNPGSGIDSNDMDSITKSIGGKVKLPVIDPFNVTLYGDANCDGTVDVTDTVLISKYIDDPDTEISEQGKINADAYNPGSGLTSADVEAITRSVAGLEELPVIHEDDVTLYGDTNCDGKVDVTDVTLISAYLNDKTVKIFEQGKINADVYDPGYGLNSKDAEAIGDFVKGETTLPVAAEFIYGDANCDGLVDLHDVILVNNYLNDDSVKISDQGKINADVYNPGSGITTEDSNAIFEFAGEKASVPVTDPFSVTLYGDVNCDGEVDVTDTVLLNKYLHDNKTYDLSIQGKINADVFNHGSGLTAEDSEAISKSIANIVDLPVISKDSVTKYGDVNCDDIVDITDVSLLNAYVAGEEVKILDQGLVNADVYYPGSDVDERDAKALSDYIKGLKVIPVLEPKTTTTTSTSATSTSSATTSTTSASTTSETTTKAPKTTTTTSTSTTATTMTTTISTSKTTAAAKTTTTSATTSTTTKPVKTTSTTTSTTTSETTTKAPKTTTTTTTSTTTTETAKTTTEASTSTSKTTTAAKTTTTSATTSNTTKHVKTTSTTTSATTSETTTKAPKTTTTTSSTTTETAKTTTEASTSTSKTTAAAKTTTTSATTSTTTKPVKTTSTTTSATTSETTTKAPKTTTTTTTSATTFTTTKPVKTTSTTTSTTTSETTTKAPKTTTTTTTSTTTTETAKTTTEASTSTSKTTTAAKTTTTSATTTKPVKTTSTTTSATTSEPIITTTTETTAITTKPVKTTSTTTSAATSETTTITPKTTTTTSTTTTAEPTTTTSTTTTTTEPTTTTSTTTTTTAPTTTTTSTTTTTTAPTTTTTSTTTTTAPTTTTTSTTTTAEPTTTTSTTTTTTEPTTTTTSTTTTTEPTTTTSTTTTTAEPTTTTTSTTTTAEPTTTTSTTTATTEPTTTTSTTTATTEPTTTTTSTTTTTEPTTTTTSTTTTTEPDTTTTEETTTTTTTTVPTTSTTEVTTTTTPSEPEEEMLGDMNGDKIIDGRDASVALTLYARSSTNIIIPDDTIRKGDVNKDSILDGRDASIILTYYAKSSSGNSMTLSEYVDSIKEEW